MGPRAFVFHGRSRVCPAIYQAVDAESPDVGASGVSLRIERDDAVDGRHKITVDVRL